MALVFRVPNDEEQIIKGGGIVFTTNKERDIFITFLPTGELHGYPITSTVWKTPHVHLQGVMKRVREGVGEVFNTLEANQVMAELEREGKIVKFGNFNYLSNDVRELSRGRHKERAIIPGLTDQIESENKIFNQNNDSDENLKSEEPDAENPEEAPIEEKENPEEEKPEKGLDFLQGVKNPSSLEFFISSMLSVANRNSIHITMQEREAGEATVLISSALIPETGFTGTIKELSEQLIPALLDVLTKKKSDLSFISNIEKQIEKRKQESIEKAKGKKEKKNKASKEDEKGEEEEVESQKTLF